MPSPELFRLQKYYGSYSRQSCPMHFDINAPCFSVCLVNCSQVLVMLLCPYTVPGHYNWILHRNAGSSKSQQRVFFVMSTNVACAKVMLFNYLTKGVIMLWSWHHHRKQEWCLHIVYQCAMYVTVGFYAAHKKSTWNWTALPPQIDKLLFFWK